jgi:hypothetical protein
MRKLKIVREIFHAQFCNIRNINNIIHSDDFEIAFSLSTEEDQNDILRIIADFDKDGIRIFIDNKLTNGTPFDQLSIRKLRDIGRFMKITNYHILNKMTLIEEIKNVAKRLKENCERKCFQSEQSINN